MLTNIYKKTQRSYSIGWMESNFSIPHNHQVVFLVKNDFQRISFRFQVIGAWLIEDYFVNDLTILNDLNTQIAAISISNGYKIRTNRYLIPL